MDAPDIIEAKVIMDDDIEGNIIICICVDWTFVADDERQDALDEE